MKSVKKVNSYALFAAGAALVICGCRSEPESATAKQTHKTDTIIIEGMQFKPASLTIQKGDTVVWLNKDIVAHTATEVDSNWASPAIGMGESWRYTPDKSADYYCTIHPVMKGKIEVKD